jgi:hypothetical protein
MGSVCAVLLFLWLQYPGSTPTVSCRDMKGGSRRAPATNASGRPSPAVIAEASARRGRPLERPAARLWLVLDRRRRMGEGRALGLLEGIPTSVWLRR